MVATKYMGDIVKRFQKIYWILILLGLGCATKTMADVPIERLYQEATIKESGERDPESAIKVYQQVIDQSESNPRLRFKARFRIAHCYEKLGKSKEAEQVYLQIIGESASVSSEAVQEALTSLRKLQAMEKAAAAPLPAASPSKPMQIASHYEPSRFSLALGGALLANAESRRQGVASVRTRILSGERPLSLYIEAGALMPVGNLQIAEQNAFPDPQTANHASLHLQYQTHLAFISELPHGQQRWVIPEGGVGVALTRTALKVNTNYQNLYSFEGATSDVSRTSVNPYFSAGFHFFPDHVVSLIAQGSYVACPHPESVNIPAQTFFDFGHNTTVTSPPHTERFNFPASFWAISLNIQIKLGRSQLVLEPSR